MTSRHAPSKSADVASGSGLSLAERAEILDLYVRYCHAIDDGDVEAWVELFTPDGRVEGAVELAGRDELHTYTIRYTAQKGEAAWDLLQHWNTSIILERDGEVVRGRCYNATVGRRDGTSVIVSQGRYDDEVVLLDGRWRFVRRRSLS